MKFGRTYQMTLEGRSGDLITIAFPTTLEINVEHDLNAETNVSNFSFYNLSKSNRENISFSTFNKPRKFKAVLRAGYVSQQPNGYLGNAEGLPVIFNGYITTAYTERHGPDLITRINAFDNGDLSGEGPSTFFDENNAYTAPAGTPFIEMVTQVMNRLQVAGVSPDPSGPVYVEEGGQLPPAVGKQGRPFNGNVWAALQDLAHELGGGGQVFIENGICYMARQNGITGLNTLGVIQSQTPAHPGTGLLGIPMYTGATISVKTIFEPTLRLGAQVSLDSIYGPASSNGRCKIISYSHSGTISGVKAGDLTSDIDLMNLSTPLGAAY